MREISYSRPLGHGWRRMRRALFEPFDLGRWFVLGFTAWLAQLGDGGSGGGGGDGVRVVQELEADSWDGYTDAVGDWWRDLFPSGLEVMVVAGLLLFGLMVVVALLWLSSRGRFMFLDNLVHGRTEVVAPWHEFAAQADSLFLWRLGFAAVSLVAVVALVGGFALVIMPMSLLDVPAAVGLPAAILLGIALFATILGIAVVEYLLNQFVVPVMYRDRVGATEAWRRFLPVFRSAPVEFLLMGLLTAALTLVVALAFAAAGLLTCCLGLILMAIPYVGTVITLPLPVTVRYMNLEFLAQFGDPWNLLGPLDGPLDNPPPSGQFEGDGTVIRPEDVGQDPGPDQPGPQGP